MKKILSMILAFTLLLSSMFLLASCGKDKGKNEGNSNEGGTENDNGGATEKVDYIVKVVDQNGDAVADAEITLYVGPQANELKTDKDGVAKFNTAPVSVPVDAILESVPREFYTISGEDEKRFAGDSYSVTFTVTKKDAYTVNVKDTFGNAVAGVTVQICAGDTCSPFTKVTDSNGEAVLYMAPDSEDVGIQINVVPEGFTKPVVKFYFEEGSYSLNIVLQ